MAIDRAPLSRPSRCGGTHFIGVKRGRGGIHFMHSRSRMTIRYTPLHFPIVSGRSTSGFHRPGRYWLHQARSAVRCSASRMKGELHPAKNPLLDVWNSAPCACFFFRIDDKPGMKSYFFFLVWSLSETTVGTLCNCLVGALPYTHHRISPPLRGS